MRRLCIVVRDALPRGIPDAKLKLRVVISTLGRLTKSSNLLVFLAGRSVSRRRRRLSSRLL